MSNRILNLVGMYLHDKGRGGLPAYQYLILRFTLFSHLILTLRSFTNSLKLVSPYLALVPPSGSVSYWYY